MEIDRCIDAPICVQMEERTDKAEIVSRIEFAIENLVKCLSDMKSKKSLVMKRCEDEADHQIAFGRTRRVKFEFNLCTLMQIYKLVKTGSRSSKRDLYYDMKSLYRNQSNLDRSITAICQLLGETRVNLNIISCSKGLIYGALTFVTERSDLIDCRVKPVLISEILSTFRLINEADFILVVEKDATFQKLIDECFISTFPRSILVTGKGYPDFCTRNILKWLVAELNIPIYGLFDGDPHGIEIMLTYKYGSTKRDMEGKGAFVDSIKWIGLKPAQFNHFLVEKNQKLPLTHGDFRKLTTIRRRAELLGEEEIVEEVDILRKHRYKLELEALTSISPGYITTYLIGPSVYPYTSA